MITSKNGGPAFPHHTVQSFGGRDDVTPYQGMTLRDWFAGQALAGLLAADPKSRLGNPCDVVAHAAYLTADAMIAERSK